MNTKLQTPEVLIFREYFPRFLCLCFFSRKPTSEEKTRYSSRGVLPPDRFMARGLEIPEKHLRRLGAPRPIVTGWKFAQCPCNPKLRRTAGDPKFLKRKSSSSSKDIITVYYVKRSQTVLPKLYSFFFTKFSLFFLDLESKKNPALGDPWIKSKKWIFFLTNKPYPLYLIGKKSPIIYKQ